MIGNRLRFSNVSRAAAFLALSSLAAFGQARDWSSVGGDAQRTSWIRSDPKIAPDTVTAASFQFLWKVKLGNEPLTAPVLIDRYIGYRGFRTYAFIGGSAEDAFALDSDVGRLEWRKHLTGNAGSDSGNCPGGMTASLTRPVTATFPSSAAAAGRGGGRGIPAKSGVGEANEGSVQLAQVANRPPARPTPPPAAMATGRGAAPNPYAPHVTPIYALSGDGALHTMYVSNGVEGASDPISFLPASANVSDFAVVDDVAYATTTGHCGGVADGVWALDLATKAVTKWEGSLNGEPAFGPAGAYVTADSKLIVLDPKTMTAGSSYDAGQPFTTAPVVFEYKTKEMVAAATKDGVLHIVDSSAPTSAFAKSAGGDAEPYALATWQTTAETRWIIAAGAKSVTGWKVVDRNGSATLQQGWALHDLNAPATPLIVNGVLFVLQRGDPSQHAVLSAFDASSGKQIWTSGDAITSFVAKTGGMAEGGSTVYFGTQDGTLWAFGFPIEH
jgi:hypothetical protein